ncbi:hypothetical protein [Parafrankia discariae]|uniref:hypothetical protein n=1 Tax=Parafrankia discariae TaxID=365528 RepID=UPI0003A13385|nr:hypothetical protein [Parafrankia discariae]
MPHLPPPVPAPPTVPPAAGPASTVPAATAPASAVPASPARPGSIRGTGGPRPRRTSALVGGLLVACLAVAGCSGSGDDDAPAPAPASGTAGTGQGASSSGAPAAGTPQASRTTRFQGADGDIEVGFVALRVDGQLARLDLLFTPRYARDPGTGITLYDMAGKRDAAVTLVDALNLRRYTVVRDSAGVALGAASGTTRTRNNVPVAGSFTFAAPPADVTTVDVYLNDRVIVDDAAITR